MSDRRLRWGGGALALLVLVALLAPLAGLRDPTAQPEPLVLSELPPLARVDALVLADGKLLYAAELRRLDDGSVEYRRGGTWKRIEASELAADGDWHRRPRFVLGTDRFGRDMLSRLVHGARISLLVGFVAAAMSLLIGTLVGVFAGIAGGWLDAALMRLTDLVLAVPRLFLALLLVALFRPSLTTTVVVLGATSWMAAARLVRGEILSLREREFVHAARAGGAPYWRLALRHLLPAALVPLIVEAVLRVGDTILLEASLSFLGLGVQSPMPSWGNLIADGRGQLLSSWWIATLPGLAIVFTVGALHLLGEAARERLRGSQ